jgi:hypothetical protein
VPSSKKEKEAIKSKAERFKEYSKGPSTPAWVKQESSNLNKVAKEIKKKEKQGKNW